MIIRINMKQEAFKERIDEIEQDYDYAALVQQVDTLYDEIGAVVMRCISTAGEDPIQLFVPEERPPYPNYPA